MSQPKFTYKNVDITNLITTGSTTSNAYVGFPPYEQASPYSYERPLPFGLNVSNVPLSNVMNSKYVEFNTGINNDNNPPKNTTIYTTYNVSSSYDSIRAVIAGGGGGGGGRGGCGWNDPGNKRNNGAYGNTGGVGAYTYLASDVSLQSTSISLKIGAGGDGGSNGGDRDTKGGSGSGANGNSGSTGQDSYIVVNTSNGSFTVYANGGSGGSGGGGGNANNADNNNEANTANAATAFPNNLSNAATVNSLASIPANLNPFGYTSNISTGGLAQSGGTAPTAGKPGYVRIYLLKS